MLANLSASNITIAKADTRRLLCLAQSARCLAAYLYAAAGTGESTTDLAWDGQAGVFENGVELASTDRFPAGDGMALADIDLDLLRQERLRMGTFDDNRRRHARPAGFAGSRSCWRQATMRRGLLRHVDRFPFVPADPDRLAQDCYEAYNIQVSGLVQRMRATGSQRIVIGVSGGLDSTQALIVAAQAVDLLGLPRTNIFGFTMPGFATGEHTKANAIRLMAAWVLPRASSTSGPRPGRCWPTSAIRSRKASRSTTSRSRTSKPGCAPTTCSGSPTTTRASCSVRATFPSWRWGGAPTALATRCPTTTSMPVCRRR